MAEEDGPYRLADFALVEDPVEVAAIGDLLAVDGGYDVAQDKPAVGVPLGRLQPLVHIIEVNLSAVV